MLYFPYESLTIAFQSQGFDVLFDEQTPDSVFEETVKRIENAPVEQIAGIRTYLIGANQTAVDDFLLALKRRLGRRVTAVIIIPLYGRSNAFSTVQAALLFLDSHMIYEGSGEFRKYEVRVEYSNGEKVEASFNTKARVKDFLELITK